MCRATESIKIGFLIPISRPIIRCRRREDIGGLERTRRRALAGHEENTTRALLLFTEAMRGGDEGQAFTPQLRQQEDMRYGTTDLESEKGIVGHNDDLQRAVRRAN